MKPGTFTHHAPRTLEEALAILAEVSNDEGRVIAGGQTLVPAMALRLARPNHLVDINGIEALRRFETDGAFLHIGACVRHAQLASAPVAGPLRELLRAVMRHIAHLPIRTRGTFCGSLANADGASEWCLVATTLDAHMQAQSIHGMRTIPAADFFQGYMTTALAPEEILTGARLPVLGPDTRFGFDEISRRAGDFAQAMCLAVFELQGGLMRQVRIGIGGVAGQALRAPQAEAACDGQPPAAALFKQVAAVAARNVEPTIGSSEAELDYRRALVRTSVERALARAARFTP
ncbi:MAG: FAD binding domain-containing protein [Pigmentiphaga sp.]|uniref:FAD binding domain-containing protein n=1 Tax=Pigmentiphaga sp. TaxID=1977564 RepID=UPI0029B9DB57|nr:FAD binding domain-containing protein [Pigmentiphaga sp.]MDX3908048.1 FAD binding domain-containing protein [Pigmentiphaga sp.]